MTARKPITATQRRARSRARLAHGIRALPAPTRYNAFVEAVMRRDKAYKIVRPEGWYRRKRNMVAMLAEIAREWSKEWLCPSGTDKR